MVCGFDAGYFGLQELGDGKKVLLFSVWDASDKNDPNAVEEEKRVKVQLVQKTTTRCASAASATRASRTVIPRLRLEGRPDVPLPGDGQGGRQADRLHCILLRPGGPGVESRLATFSS